MRQDVPTESNGNTPFEKDLYFYHPDHIGSSNYITDLKGKLYEHLEYFPFGEGWIEENTNVQRTPYLFTRKSWMRRRDSTTSGHGTTTRVRQSGRVAIPFLENTSPGTQRGYSYRRRLVYTVMDI